MTKGSDGNIPVLYIKGEGLARTWQESMILLYEKGCEVKTQYDKLGDPPSKDATMIIEIENPDSEPMIHKCFPGGLEDLEEYRLELLEGIKDTWIREQTNPEDTRWEYTYHGRICNREMPLTEAINYLSYLPDEVKEELKRKGVRVLLDMPWAEKKVRIVNGKEESIVSINQLEACIEMLTNTPYTRRAQVITWQPEEDLVSYDPACLQRIWFRMLRGDDGIYRLNMNLDIRSNDAWGASFMNMFGFISMQEEVVRRVGQNLGEEVKLGRYLHKADSFHIYGKDLNEFRERFLGQLEKRSFEEQTFRRDDGIIQEIMREARPKILEKVRKQSERYVRKSL